MADTSSDSPQVGGSSAAGAGGDNTALPKQKSAKELAKEAKRLEKLEKFKAKQEKQAQQPKKAAVEVSCAFHIHAPVIILVAILSKLVFRNTHTHTHPDQNQANKNHLNWLKNVFYSF